MKSKRIKQITLTLQSRGLTETAFARTRTSFGFRFGTGTFSRSSKTSGPPKRGNITARQPVKTLRRELNLAGREINPAPELQRNDLITRISPSSMKSIYSSSSSSLMRESACFCFLGFLVYTETGIKDVAAFASAERVCLLDCTCNLLILFISPVYSKPNPIWSQT